MSLLTIAQSVAVRVGLQKPTIVASNSDGNVQQIQELINEAGQELAASFSWQELTKEAAFTTVAAQLQGTMATLTGPDFGWVLNNTIWNRTQRRPLFGPKSPAEWQQIQAQFTVGPWQQFRIRGDQLLFVPAPAAGQSCYFEWVSTYWCTDQTGATGKTAMTVDTDVSVLVERLLILDTVWRFKAAKKLDFSEDQEKAEEAIGDEKARNANPGVLNMNGVEGEFRPGILVQAGNYTL